MKRQVPFIQVVNLLSDLLVEVSRFQNSLPLLSMKISIRMERLYSDQDHYKKLFHYCCYASG